MSGGRQLEIFKAEVPDTGIFTCRATNEAGIAERDYEVHILGLYTPGDAPPGSFCLL